MITSHIRQILGESLEYGLTKSIKKCPAPHITGFWCDGIILDPPVRENGVVQFKGLAFFGIDGQERYKVYLELGSYHKKKYELGRHLADELQLENSAEWYIINVEKKEIRMTIK